MNITKEIIKRLSSLGFDGKISPMVEYFLNVNLTNIFGTTKMDPKDIDMLLSSKKFEIKTVFREEIFEIKINKCDDGESIICNRIDPLTHDEINEFVINVKTNGKTIIGYSNYLAVLDNGELVHFRNYDYDIESQKFTLSLVNPDESVKYNASLSAMNAKVKNRDWFTYERSIPSEEKVKSFLKSIVDEFQGNGKARQITTSNNMLDMDMFGEEVFGELMSDARRVLTPPSQDPKIRVLI